MTANPLMLKQPARPGRETAESLEAFAEELNRMAWVKASGLPYFVNRRINPKGELERFLDRKIAVGMTTGAN